MPADKDAARRRRQARNRQERLNRQTRVEGAKRSSSTRPSRTVDAPPAKAESSSSRSTSSTRSAGGFLDKIFPPRPAPAPRGQDGRPARRQPVRSHVVEVEEASGVRGALTRMAAQPGGKATMLAATVALASAVLVLFFPVAPRVVLDYYGQTVIVASDERERVVNARLERYADSDAVFSYDLLLRFANPVSVLVVTLIPLAITGFALSGLTKPTRSRTLLIAAGLAALYSFFGSFSLFLVGAIALGFAAYQSRKADALTAAAAVPDEDSD